MKKLSFLAMLCGVSLFLVGCSNSAVEDMDNADPTSSSDTDTDTETGDTDTETGDTGTAPDSGEEPPAIPETGDSGVSPVPGTEDAGKGANVDVPEVKLDP